jgi:hypothetical protein
MANEYEISVFINCPFDAAYQKLFHAIIFTVHDCGCIARSALEMSDASQVRVNKILEIISECRIGIHDISRTELDPKSKLPRFNMPLELGMFLGAKQYGDRIQRGKVCLVLDRSQYRYQRFCSDIAGQDIAAHNRKVATAIAAVRDFLRSAAPAGVLIPGSNKILQRYLAFSATIPDLCRALGQKKDKLTFRDYTAFVARWLKQHAEPSRQTSAR